MRRFFAKCQRARKLVSGVCSRILLVGRVRFYIPNTSLNPNGNIATTNEDRNIVVAKVG